MEQNNLNVSYITEYDEEKGLTVTERLADYLEYSNKEVKLEEKVYIAKDYVAYCDITIKRNPVEKNYIIEVDNIRRKEYFDDPLSETEKEQLNKIANGINEIKKKSKYIKECGGDIEDHSFTPKFL